MEIFTRFGLFFPKEEPKIIVEETARSLKKFSKYKESESLNIYKLIEKALTSEYFSRNLHLIVGKKTMKFDKKNSEAFQNTDHLQKSLLKLAEQTRNSGAIDSKINDNYLDKMLVKHQKRFSISTVKFLQLIRRALKRLLGMIKIKL